MHPLIERPGICSPFQKKNTENGKRLVHRNRKYFHDVVWQACSMSMEGNDEVHEVALAKQDQVNID